ncbi:HNH endonuclease [Microbacterium sp. NPDC088619]|uniref:HNH endonuclease n=1 Tax=Microbacterium sp. NPDC088619 TaxID=3364196 RepID=UPI0038155B9F
MCRGPFENLDHVKPVSLGGITTLSNLRPACVSCNSLKRARWYGPQEVHRFIRT